MPYTTSWLIKDRVVYSEFHGAVSSDELATFIEQVLDLAKAGTGMVHHISNSLDLQKLEFSLKTAQTLVKGRKLTTEITWQVDINRNPINRWFADFLSQFVGVRTRTFPTLTEAFEFLKAQDPTLADVDWEALRVQIESKQEALK